MKFLLIILFVSIKCFSQDSIKLKITKVGTTPDKNTVYWLKPIMDKKDTSTIELMTGKRVLIRKQSFTIVKECSDRKKGDMALIAKKDLAIIKDSFTKIDF